MMSSICLTSVFALMLATLAFSVQVRQAPEAPSKRLLAFISVLSGYYSNLKEVKNEVKFGDEVVEDVVNVTMRPVYVPALSPSLTVYFEQTDNRRVFRMQILVLSEDEEGIIHLVPLNFTDPSQHQPNTFDITVLENMAKSDFEVSPEECNLQFLRLEKDVFMGTMPDCTRQDLSGSHPIYAMTITCHTFSVITSSEFSREKPSRVPYDHIRVSASYPLLPYMLVGVDDFQDPCEN